jgi:cell division septum initiation protein DivIVA
MTYTPVELRHVKVGRSLFGYNRATVEQVIEEVAQSFEATWRERGELADKVESLEKQLEELRGREHLLTQTLVAAEQAASDVREKARREAEAIITEAHNESRAIGRSAHAQREALLIEARRIEAMLRSALGVIQEGTSPTPAPDPAVEPTAEPAVEEAAEPEAVSPEPVPAPIALPPVLDEQPEPDDHVSEWGREDTREFEPIALRPAEEAPVAAEPEPEHEADFDAPAAHLEEAPQPQQILQPVPGRESRDFDWGE